MTLHLKVSESVSKRVLTFLENLVDQGETVEIMDDTLYQYEKKGILNGLKQLEEGAITSSDDILKTLQNDH